jgi:intracellular multiplication protein IcmL
MSFFTKKIPPEKQAGTEAKSPPAVDAEMIIGGIGWYSSQYRRAMKLVLALILSLLAAVTLVFFLVLTRPTPRYFAATPDLRLAPLVPLDKPVLTQQGLLNWVSETITNAVSLDFLEWRDKLSRVRENFEDEAFKSFLSSLQSSGILDMIRDKRLSVSAVVTRAPVIIASGLVGGKATWKVEFPLVVSYESSQGVESTQHLMATVLVCRASTVTSPRGVVIQQVVLKRDS